MENVFVLVAHMEIVRFLLALAAQKGWCLFHLDVKSAFLNGKILEEVFVEQPKGFEIEKKPKMVYKLKKALYRLKQAPRSWYSKIDAYFLQQGFQRSETEHTLYKRIENNGDILVVCIYVDDILCLSSSLDLVTQFKLEMQQNFDMTDLGLLSYFLGMEVMQDKHGVFVTQKRYAQELLKKFNMLQCKAAPTPMCTSDKLQAVDCSGDAEIGRYRSLVGQLIYLTHSRPDISFVVGVLSRYMNKPSKIHAGAGKRVLRYLAGTADFGLWYAHANECKLVGFSDSDWAGSLEDRRSTTGVVFNLGTAAISWMSKKQEVISLSTTEAEYVAASAAACQCLWLRKLMNDCGLECKEASEIWCDNKSTIAIAKNPMHHGRTKHMDIKFHFIRNLISEGVIVLKHCSTDEQQADILTKPLSVQKHNQLRAQMGVCNLQSKGGYVGD